MPGLQLTSTLGAGQLISLYGADAAAAEDVQQSARGGDEAALVNTTVGRCLADWMVEVDDGVMDNRGTFLMEVGKNFGLGAFESNFVSIRIAVTCKLSLEPSSPASKALSLKFEQVSRSFRYFDRWSTVSGASEFGRVAL